MDSESSDYYLVGHCIDGRVLYPATGYLVLAWRTLARSLGITMEQMPVIFEEVTIHQATILSKKGEGEVASGVSSLNSKDWERWAEGKSAWQWGGRRKQIHYTSPYPVIHPEVGYHVVSVPCCA